MSTVDLLQNLQDRGITLWSEGEELRYKAPKFALDAVIMAELREKKGELLKIMSPPLTEALKPSQATSKLGREEMESVVDVFRQLREWRDEGQVGHSRTHRIRGMRGALD